jgi:hypothetical protein
MIYPAILPNPEKLWNDNRPDLAERKMRGLLEPARWSGIEGYYLQLLTQIARAQAAQGNLGAAHETLNEVQRELKEGLDAASIHYFIERARVLLLEDRVEHAEYLLHRAWQIAIASRHARLAETAQQMMNGIEQRLAS